MAGEVNCEIDGGVDEGDDGEGDSKVARQVGVDGQKPCGQADTGDGAEPEEDGDGEEEDTGPAGVAFAGFGMGSGAFYGDIHSDLGGPNNGGFKAGE